MEGLRIGRQMLFLVLWTVFVCTILEARSQREASGQELFNQHKNELEELQKLAQDGGHPNPGSITNFDSDVCYTNDCIEAAKEFMLAINFTVDPCPEGDWLKFICVRRTMHSVEGEDEFDDMYKQSQVGYLGSVALGQTLAILESKNLPSILNEAVIYYEQCEKWRNETSDDVKVESIVSYLNSFGEWPLLKGTESPGSKFDWTEMMANTVKVAVAYGVAPYLFDIFIEEGDIPLLFTGELTLTKKDEEIVEVIKILRKSKENLTENDYNQIKEMRDFMTNLTFPSEDSIETSTIKDVTAKYDFGQNFDLADFYRKMLAGTRVQITPESQVAADFAWLLQQIQDVNGAPPRVIANILFLQTAAALLTRLTTLTHLQHLRNLDQYRRVGPLDCVTETYEKFDYAMSYEYMRRHYDYHGTPDILKALVENLKEGYVKAIEHSPFLTSQSKVFAIDKAKDVHTFIAAEHWVLDEEKLKDDYKNINVTKNADFVTNHVAGLKFHWGKFLEITNPNIFNHLVGDVYTGYVSTKYNYYFNQIRIQAALAQHPVFRQKYPGFMNYAGIGSVIAHELAHSFDTTGVHFDRHGHRGDFWDDESYEMYYNWTDTLIQDYNSDKYNKPDPWGSLAVANIDHAQTVDDDIADTVGVYLAYKGYDKYLTDLEKNGKKDLVLPGLKEYTSQKLFWMKYANTWCEHTDKSYLHTLRPFNMHSPGNVRATLPLTRSKEWAQDFGCPAPEKSDFST